jgi:glutamate-1-semialdehyde 2,1-aminomutase
VPFNDTDAVENVFKQHNDIAAVIVEPVVGNMGCVPPRDGFLQSLRELTTSNGALLICDEVMTGFRLARGGAQALYGIKPDITCLGKIIGGGLPVGAYGGSRDLIRNIAPTGPIYQAGTLSGNPLAMTAGLLTLRRLKDRKIYEELERRSAQLGDGLASVAAEAEITTTTNRVGSMWTTFFSEGPIVDWTTANQSDREIYGRFFHAMLNEGVYLAPSQFEAGFVSITHTEEIIEQTINAARNALQGLRKTSS